MKRWHAILFLGLIASSVNSVGCSSKAASPERTAPGPAGPTLAPPSKQPERAAKPTSRESALARYSNPEYGVSFRYPRNFALEEADNLSENSPEDASGARTPEQLAQEEPGTLLLATIVVPDDAYPNTTFAGASLQLAVNRYLTAGSCRRELISRLGDSNGRNGAATVQGIEFAWADNDEGDASTEFFERDYAGFANGTCYEFFLRIGAGTTDDADATRPPDEKKILAQMEKVLASLQFESKSVSLLDATPSGQDTIRKR
jgi:hypothetical protein